MVNFFDAISKVSISRNAEKSLLEKGEQALGRLVVVNEALEHGAKVVGKKVSAEELAQAYQAYNIPILGTKLQKVGGLAYIPEHSVERSEKFRKMLELRNVKMPSEADLKLIEARAALPREFEPYGIKDGEPIDLAKLEKAVLKKLKKVFPKSTNNKKC